LTPLFALYRVLPLLGWFRIPGRIVLLTDFSFAILAAVALSHVLRPETEASRARAALIALPLAAGLARAGSQASHGTPGGPLLAVASAAGLVGVLRGRARA